MSKLMYKPVSVAVSVLGGMAAGAIFKQVWRLAAHELTGSWPGEEASATEREGTK